MSVDNKIQSFTANSSVLTNLQELTTFPDGAPIRYSHPLHN